MRVLTLNQYTAIDTFARIYDAGGNAARIAREALIGEVWVPLTWEARAYSAAHQHVVSTSRTGRRRSGWYDDLRLQRRRSQSGQRPADRSRPSHSPSAANPSNLSRHLSERWRLIHRASAADAPSVSRCLSETRRPSLLASAAEASWVGGFVGGGRVGWASRAALDVRALRQHVGAHGEMTPLRSSCADSGGASPSAERSPLL